MDVYPALISGEQLRTKDVFEDIDPSTGQTIGEVARCGSDEVDSAVEAARETFETVWRRTDPNERGRTLRVISELIRRDKDSMAEIESRDTGKPLTQARTDVEVAARYFEFYGSAIEAFHGTTIPLREDTLAYTVREPYGVTAHIIPWNYPLQIAGRTVAPALATGNCCVLKPAEEAPLNALRLAELAIEAGLPAGALNVVPGYGEEAGASLAGHAGIDHLSFTGSVAVGRLVSKAAAANLIPVTLELGGKSPNVVLADADLETAIPAIINSIIQNAGQTCSAGSRLLVDKQLHQEVIQRVAEGFKALRIGPGLEDPDLGPLISRNQQERVALLVEHAKKDARLVVGGAIPPDERLSGGFFFSPTLFDDVPEGSTIATEEVFGPVLSVLVFDDLDDAARLANSTDYGLIAALWTQDLSKALWLIREIRAGQVFVNNYGAGGGVELPFGGFKRSGYGREKGFEALAGYTQTKTVAMKFAPHSSEPT